MTTLAKPMYTVVKAWVIECCPGCSCCAEDSCYFGPYRTKAKATEQRARWLAGTDPCPIPSYCAPKPKYELEEVTAEELPDGRVILSGVRVVPDWTPRKMVYAWDWKE